MADAQQKQRNAEAVNSVWQAALTREDLLRLALRDPLTGLMNRRAFDEELRQIWIQAREMAQPVGVLIIDVDNFKLINDTYGHMVGDQVLKESAQLACSCVPESNMVCRYHGGDEFVAILPRATEADTRQAAERMLVAFRQSTLCQATYAIQTTVSIGGNSLIATVSTSVEQFLIQADRALYRAKQTGRNQVCLAGEAPSQPPGAAVEATPAGILGANPVVLVVDDDHGLCLLFQRMLGRQHYEVLIAETGQAALDIANREQGRIDAVLMDINLGVDDGLEVLQNLHAIDDTIIGIIITGAATLAAAVASLRQGAYDFLEKPIGLEQLTAVLERAVQYRRLLSENKRYRTRLEEMVREKNAALSRVIDQASDSYQFTLEAMADMLDAREQKTGAHSKRVSRIAVLLARKMGCSLEEVEVIGTGALLHDIGKVGIPDAILLKAGPLTPEEREIMKMHPQIGYNIIKAGPGLEPASEIVIEHQERFDGGGYPRGLKGVEITLGARIFAVVDAYDAIRSPRSYSKGRSAEGARQEILRNRGTQFDPAVVDIFLQSLDEIEEIGQWPP